MSLIINIIITIPQRAGCSVVSLTILEKKKNRYVARLFNLVLPPLVRHGIGLESHGYKIAIRQDK